MPAARFAVFDAYGTLFNVHSAVARLSSLLGESAGQVSELWRQKQLEYTWTRTLMNRYVDFWQVTEEALDYALAASGHAEPRVRADLLEAYRTLEAFGDVRETLAGYRELGFQVVVFSNATAAMLSRAVASAGLDDLVGALCSVDAQGVYKPAVSVYAQLQSELQAAPGSIVFHSSNAWDAAGAASFGWRALWINRGGKPREYRWLPAVELVDLPGALAHVRAQPTGAG